jgi:hypothetical protein
VAGARAAFRGLTVDTSSISFTYSEGLTRNKSAEEAIAEITGRSSVVYNDLRGQCSYALGTGDNQFEAVLSADQEFTRSESSQEELSSIYGQNTLEEKVSGVGRAAKIATAKPVPGRKFQPELLVRYPNMVVQVGLADFRGTDEQRIRYLRNIARQLPARLR